MLTMLKPEIHRIKGTRKLDVFEQKGEPISIRYLCHDGVRLLFGRRPKRFHSVIVEMRARRLSAAINLSVDSST